MYTKNGEQYTDLLELIRLDERTVQVNQDDFNSSTNRLYSEGFSRCIALVFLNYDKTLGALAHISGATYPSDLIEGYVGHVWGGSRIRTVEKPNDIFTDPSKVKVIAIYDKSRYAWGPSELKTELKKAGFKDFSYIALKNSKNGDVYHKTVALDVNKGLIYIGSTANKGLFMVPMFKDS